LYCLVCELSSNQALGIKDSVVGVSGNLVLGSVSNQTLIFSKGNVGWGGVETLIVGDDLNLVVNPDTDARVGGAQVNSNASHFL
jgi:hypothetical protein